MTAQRPIRLGLPWQMPHYRPLNGSHPLVESFLYGNASVHAVDLDARATASAQQKAAVLLNLTQQARLIPEEATPRFIEWLDIDAQCAIEAQSQGLDALFLHTTPLYVGNQPFLFHFESFPSLFMPFMFTGTTTGIDLPSQGYFKLVRSVLESDRCLRIFSHVRSSLEILCWVFDSPLIAGKCHHVPLGIRVRDNATATAKYEQPGPLRMLYTNSLHNHPDSFYLRGGHHLLSALARLRARGVDVELTVLSAVPDDFEDRFPPAEMTGVTWIDERVDDTTLEKLFLDHHLFALPAAGLHSHSLMRAFAHGCVPIISDAPGYEEYTRGIEDSVLTVQGVRSLIYHREESGWLSDQYAPFVDDSENFTSQIEALVLEHGKLSHLRELAVRNLDHCRRRFDPGVSHAAFNSLFAER
jgi:hypothetical protein